MVVFTKMSGAVALAVLSAPVVSQEGEGSEYGMGHSNSRPKCPTGYEYSKDYTTANCAINRDDLKSCQDTCCAANPKTCIGMTNIICKSDSYNDITSPDYNKRAAADFTKNQACCAKKAKCKQATKCATGYKKKSGTDAVVCSGNVTTCETATSGCCEPIEPDLKTCGGFYAAYQAAEKVKAGSGNGCPGGKYFEVIHLFDVGTTTRAAWNKKATTDGSECCKAKATCKILDTNNHECPAGMKKKTSAGIDAVTCTSNGESCEAKGTPCCEADPATCGGSEASISCGAGKYSILLGTRYYPAEAARKVKHEGKINENCCKEKAKCSDGFVGNEGCKPGYKRKAGSDNALCAKDSTSCTDTDASKGDTACCVKDDKKCGGLTGFTCAKGTFDPTKNTKKYPDMFKVNFHGAFGSSNEQNIWLNKAATEATKNTDCCIAQSSCGRFVNAYVGAGHQMQPGFYMIAATLALLAARH